MTIVGAVTLLFGAIIGCAKDDIKKVLADSTVCQIGYMFLAVGLGPAGYALGIVHLLTHGFFKAGLFLGAGSVMHGMNDEVDMRRFGGLARYMPITFVTFMASATWRSSASRRSPASSPRTRSSRPRSRQGGTTGWLLGSAALLGAGLTAFYMTRLLLMTFFGEARWARGRSPARVAAGDDLADDPAGARRRSGFGAFEILGDRLARLPRPGDRRQPGRAGRVQHRPAIVALVLVVAGRRRSAWVLYGRRPVPETAPAGSFAVTAARKDLYGDAINESLLMRPGQ